METNQRPSKQQNSIHDARSKEEIRHRVYVIAETILHIAKSVEEALANITAVKEVLNQITNKLNQDQFICEEEKALLELAEHWLNEEKIQMVPSVGDEPATIRGLNLSQIAALGDSLVSTSTENANYSSCLDTPVITKVTVAGSTQTLNEGPELDWDGHGVELTESIHSTYSGATTAFANPYTICSNMEADDISEIIVPKSCSYDGIYEEEMEFTLEVEEGFYSDGSSINGGFQDTLPHYDLSPQADSGVTQLDSTHSTDRSVSHPDSDLITQASPNYNRDINTWDTFATVNIEEDMFSITSSANSQNSTPVMSRKAKSTTPSLIRNNRTSATDSLQTKVLTEVVDFPQTSTAQITTLTDTRLRASSVGDCARTKRDLSVKHSKWRSNPKLSSEQTLLPLPSGTSCERLEVIDKKDCNGKPDNGSAEQRSCVRSPNSSLAEASTLSDKYDLSFMALPPALQKNNYYHKARKAVFV
ncbi:uncharacterized protein [Watersipora subatra]|uniref:uncharacterized protein n=1 Tax=Watersipora subatra TaxID=2589382 RepID=UPI00355B4D7D